MSMSRTTGVPANAQLSRSPYFITEMASKLEGELDCPDMGKLLRNYPLQALTLFEGKGAIIVQPEIKISCYVKETGSDNIKTWSDYLKSIEKLLIEQGSDVHGDYLEIAMKRVAGNIGKMHYDQYPNWPTVEQNHQSTPINLKQQMNYAYEGDQVWVVASGSLVVTDRRPAQKTYVAEVSGRPDFKTLKTQMEVMKGLENLSKTSGYQAIVDRIKDRAASSVIMKLQDI